VSGQFRKLTIAHERVPHRGAYAILCYGCGTPLRIRWGDNATGFAQCSCGHRFAYKHVYSKFVRA